MLVCDHINMFGLAGNSPLRWKNDSFTDYYLLLFARRGPNDESFGPRFFALNGLYDTRLRELARSAAKQVLLHSVSTFKQLKVYDGDATWNFSILPVCIIHDALYQIPKEYLIFANFLCMHIWGYSISDKSFREEGLKEVVKNIYILWSGWP